MKKKDLKSYFIYTLLIIATTSLSGCLDTDEPQMDNTPVSLVSIYNASPDTEDLKIRIGDETINTVFEYSDYTDYLRFEPGTRQLAFLNYDSGDSLTGLSYNFMENNYYSVFVANRASEIESFVIKDEPATDATSNEAIIRFINLSPDASALDLKVEDSEVNLFSGVFFKSYAPFTSIEGEPTTFELKASDDDEILVTSTSVKLEPGMYYTIIAQGFMNPEDNAPALTIKVLNN